jgi:hypothetical protein
VSTLTDSSAAGPGCENIGPRERAKRLRFGIGALLLVDVVAILLVVEHAARPWRFVVFPLLFIAAIGLLQVRERTCVALVARGVRDMDDGEKPVTDPAEQRQLRAQARRIYVQSTLIAAVFALVFYALPL